MKILKNEFYEVRKGIGYGQRRRRKMDENYVLRPFCALGEKKHFTDENLFTLDLLT